MKQDSSVFLTATTKHATSCLESHSYRLASLLPCTFAVPRTKAVRKERLTPSFHILKYASASSSNHPCTLQSVAQGAHYLKQHPYTLAENLIDISYDCNSNLQFFITKLILYLS